MENTDNIVLPTLEQLQQRFDEVPRLRASGKPEYVWFKADDVARVFGFSGLSKELLHSIKNMDRISYTFSVSAYENYNSYGPDFQEFYTEHRSVINQYGVAQLAERTPFPLCIRFKYWLYGTCALTGSTINNEPRFRDLEIIHDSLTQQITNTKETLYKNEATQTENTRNYVTHDIEFEREITKRLEIENNFQLELRKLELRRFEIEQHKKNSYHYRS